MLIEPGQARAVRLGQGRNLATPCRLSASRASMARLSTSRPSPVIAETGTPRRPRPVRDLARCRRARSALFRTSMHALRPIGIEVPSLTMPFSTPSTSACCAVAIGMGDVTHMQDDIGLRHLLQRGAEGGDQFGRQFADEPDCVRQDRRRARWQGDAAHGGIERREELILGVYRRRRSAR